ncbi:SPOC domain-like protein [Backusella circina FSU 941]|nr:SPOC domain-like protein [Backusella circina FSU 941]
MKDHPNDAFQKALNLVVNSIENKVITKRKSDLVSVLLAGTPETENRLAETQGGYGHITEVCDLSQPILPVLRRLINTTSTEDPNIQADILDALIIGIYMIEQKCKKLKYIKHIMLLTDSTQEIDWRDLDEVKQMLANNGIALTVVGVDLNKDTKNNENYTQWKNLTDPIPDAYLVTLKEAMEEIYAFHNKDVRPTPVYNGFMYLGNTSFDSSDFCAISCKMYLRTTDNKKPISATQYSTLSEGPTYAVIRERKYTIAPEDNLEEDDGDAEMEVEQKDIEKGYRFGKSIVKVSLDELEYSKFHLQRELTILSFVPMNSIPRDYFVSKVHVVTAGDIQKEESGRAISALSRALFEKQVGAIARWVQKIGNPPKVGVLLPYFEPGIALLHFIQLPFANDMLFYKFDPEPTFNRNNPQEEEEAERLMDEFIDKMDIGDLTKPDPEDSTKTVIFERLIPEDTFNPTVFMVESAVKKRGLNESAPLPDLDPRLKANIDLLPEHVEISKEYGKKLQEIFKVKKVEKKKTSKYKNDSNQDDQLNVGDLIYGENPQEDGNNISSILRIDVRKIGMEDPIADFNAMVNNTEEDLVELAVIQLGDIIFEIVSTSFGDLHSKKAVGYLAEMRKVAVKEEEAETFNTTLHKLKDWYNGTKTLASVAFWKLLRESELTLISNDETNDRKVRDVTREDALKFIEGETDTNNNNAINMDDDMEMWDDDDLLDEL